MLDKDIISVVSEEIAYFLTIERQAAIPGFGRFVSLAQSAAENENASELTAPTIQITFEPNLEETDTKFTDYFANYHSEAAPIDEFVVRFISKIKEENSVLLPELGMCILDKNGSVHFESLDQAHNILGFDSPTVTLKPVSKVQDIPKPEGANTPGEAATPSASASNTRSNLIRMGMVLSSLVLLVVFLSTYRWTENTTAEYQKVPTNYNVSPQDQEVIVASMDGNAPSGEISAEKRQEILERQRLMSEEVSEPQPVLQTSTIVTNTFGSNKNVQKQLDLISDLGYNGSTIERTNGLVSTLITVEYHNEAELDDMFVEIKKHFHRAKLK